MKKLIFLMFVVGIASAANANMVLELRHGDADTVDVVATVGYTVGDDIYFAVVGDTSKVTISGGSVVIPPAPSDTQIYPVDAQALGMCSVPLNGMCGYIWSMPGSPTGTGTYIDEIDWVLVGSETYAEVYLIGTQDFVYFETLSTITVPEPTAITLLGLGGLLLLRRRR